MKKDLKLHVGIEHDPFREDFLIFEHAPEDQPNSLSSEANQQNPSTVPDNSADLPPSNSHYFSLHVDHHDDVAHSTAEQLEHSTSQKIAAQTAETVTESKELKSDQSPESASPQPNNKTTLKDLLKQLLAAMVFLVIGYLLLNFSATWKITKSKIAEITDSKARTPLEDFIDTDPTDSSVNNIDQPNVDNSGNLVGDALDIVDSNSVLIEGKKRDIPALDMEISPLSNRLIIPRISENVPVVRVSSENLLKRDWGALEKDIQKALQNGVVHYPGTSLPNQSGNVVITGHSSYFPWDAGRFKDVFALLHDVVIGDRIVLFYNQKKYVYEVDNIKVVLPKDIEILKQTPFDQLTLITCTPVGTNLKRLIVTARPVSVENVNDGRIVR